MGNAPCCSKEDKKSDVVSQDGPSPDFSDKITLLSSQSQQGLAKQNAEKEKANAKEKEAKEAERRRKQAQKQAKEKAEKEAQEIERCRKAEEAKEFAARQARLGPLGCEGAKLQVELETGWVDCGVDEMKQVCDHVAGGGTTFSIQARGAMYLIDWTNPNAPTQKNAMSGKTRKMRVI